MMVVLPSWTMLLGLHWSMVLVMLTLVLVQASDDEDAKEGDLVRPKKNDVVSTKLRSWVSLLIAFCQSSL